LGRPVAVYVYSVVYEPVSPDGSAVFVGTVTVWPDGR
jgi:hypothetical protein